MKAWGAANMIDIELTKEEVEILKNYLDRKLYKLEEAGLTDSYCYPRLYQIRRKLGLQNNENML